MRQMDVAVGRVVYTPILSPNGGFKADLTIMRLGDDAFRVVTGGAHGMADMKWFADHLPADGSVQIHDQHRTPCTTLGLWGPRARDILAERSPATTSRMRAWPFGRCREIEVGSLSVLISRISYVGDLGWELYVPFEQGARLWDLLLEAGRAARDDPRGHRRLQHHRSAGEVLPRLRRRARHRLQRRRGRDGLGQGQGPGLHRQGGARRPARVRACGGDVRADGRRPHLRERRQALHARQRPDPHARTASR